MLSTSKLFFYRSLPIMFLASLIYGLLLLLVTDFINNYLVLPYALQISIQLLSACIVLGLTSYLILVIFTRKELVANNVLAFLCIMLTAFAFSSNSKLISSASNFENTLIELGSFLIRILSVYLGGTIGAAKIEACEVTTEEQGQP